MKMFLRITSRSKSTAESAFPSEPPNLLSNGTPFGSFVPTMKISTNTQLAEFKANWIDFNAGTLVEDEEPQAVLERFIGKVLATAGGERLKHEETGFKEIAIFKTGVTL